MVRMFARASGYVEIEEVVTALKPVASEPETPLQ